MNLRSLILCVLGLAAGISVVLFFSQQRSRLAHFEFVAAATETNLAKDLSTPSGYVDNQRRAIVGGNSPESYAWIAETEDFAHGAGLRVQRTNAENAPDGREILASSPYRWWVATIARVRQLTHKNESVGQSIESSALYADLALALIAIVIALAMIPCWGGINAAWIVMGLVLLFPAAEFFSAGQPQNRGLFSVAALAALFALLPSLRRDKVNEAPFFNRFLLSGFCTAAAIWTQPSWGLILAAAIFVGEILSQLFQRAVPNVPLQKAPHPPAGWAWGLGGAVASLLAYAIDYVPAHWKEVRLDCIHPVYVVLFLTAGCVATVVQRFVAGPDALPALRDPASAPQAVANTPAGRRYFSIYGLIAAAGVIISAFCIRRALAAGRSPFTIDLWDNRLSAWDTGGFAANLGSWVVHHDLSLSVAAALVTILLIPIGAVAVFDRQISSVWRKAICQYTAGALLLGVFAFFHVRAMGFFELSLLPLFVALQAAPCRVWLKWTSAGVLATACICGGVALARGVDSAHRTDVSRSEVRALVERDLAEWLTVQAGEAGAIVLAPPDLSAALSHFGGLRIICSPNPENAAGLSAATHILFATSQDEAHASIQRRQITFIVLASWDPFFEDVAQRSGTRLENTVLGLLQQWRPPRWLRPIPYPLPQISGFENERVTVFEVVDIQENAVALSHLAEYFAETEQFPAAGAVSHALETYFADDFGAAIARIEVDASQNQPLASPTAWAVIESHLNDGSADTLPWDRRVALATVLANARRMNDAKGQLDACLHDMDETQLRTLTPLALFRFQSLLRALKLEEPTAMRQAALKRLPAEMRHALGETNRP